MFCHKTVDFKLTSHKWIWGARLSAIVNSHMLVLIIYYNYVTFGGKVVPASLEWFMAIAKLKLVTKAQYISFDIYFNDLQKEVP